MTGTELMTDAELLGKFTGRHDPAAFEALVRRHGPVVFRVCRDVLDDPGDAEDAFQATFLVLVRRAGSVRDPESLGRWLYEVAYRVAVRTRAAARLRRDRESRGAEMATTCAGHDDAGRRELRPVVRAELGRLPEKLRGPLILCYMEGRSYQQAARRLRVPLGTLKDRLGRGRELLRSRLARRGVAVTALLLLTLLSEEAGAVPPDLIDSTVNSGLLTARRPWPLPATIPARVARLAEGELGAGSLRRWASLVALASLLATGGLLVALSTRAVHAGSLHPGLGIFKSASVAAGCHGG